MVTEAKQSVRRGDPLHVDDIAALEGKLRVKAREVGCS
jgi:hypothetical protein